MIRSEVVDKGLRVRPFPKLMIDKFGTIYLIRERGGIFFRGLILWSAHTDDIGVTDGFNADRDFTDFTGTIQLSNE